MLIVRGRAWSWAHMVAGAYCAWARIGCGRVSVVGAYRAWARIGRERVSVVGVVVVHGWGVVVHAGWSSVGGGEGGRRGPWALSVGAGYRLRALGVARARWVPLWALGIVRRQWVDVGCCGRWGSFTWGRCWACCRCWAWGRCWVLWWSWVSAGMGWM